MILLAIDAKRHATTFVFRARGDRLFLAFSGLDRDKLFGVSADVSARALDAMRTGAGENDNQPMRGRRA